MALRGYWLFPFRAARLDMNGSFVILKPAAEFCQAHPCRIDDASVGGDRAYGWLSPML